MNLEYASNTSLMPIDISSIQINNDGGTLYKNTPSLPSSLLKHSFGKLDELPKKIGSTEIVDLKEAYKQYIKITKGTNGSSNFPEIIRAQELLHSLKFIPENSAFHILGLFSIIERLITHNPKLEDRGDSITHQMQSKIALLEKRFIHKISPDTFFHDAPEKKSLARTLQIQKCYRTWRNC